MPKSRLSTGVPLLGAGLGYRPALEKGIDESWNRIDWLEIHTDNFFWTDEARYAKLDALREKYVLVPHGLEMSVGSDEPLDTEYLRRTRLLADRIDAPWVTDHLCFTGEGSIASCGLLPLRRTEAKARQVADRVGYIQRHLGRPFALENVTYQMDIPADLREDEFLTEVLERADCGLLLDLTNLVINARRHGYDPYTFLGNIPLHRIVQVHVAGGHVADGIEYDSHSHPVPEQVWRLLRHVVGAIGPVNVLLERDDNFPDDFGDLLRELDLARGILGMGGGRDR